MRLSCPVGLDGSHGAVEIVLVYAAVNGHVAVICRTVGIAEYQRYLVDSAQAQIVAGIKLQRGDVALAAVKMFSQERADICIHERFVIRIRICRHRLDVGGDTALLINRQFALLIGGKLSADAVTVFIDHGGSRLGIELEEIEMILERLCVHLDACFHARIRVGGFDGDAIRRVALADKQEVGSRSVRGIAVVADIGIQAALLIVYGDKLGIVGFPLDAIRQHTPDACAVVGGNHLLQADIGTQSSKVLKAELIAAFIHITLHLISVVHRDGLAVHAIARAAGGAANRAGSHIRYNNVENILIVDRQKQGVYAPLFVVIITGVYRDGVYFLQTGGFSCRKGDHTGCGGSFHLTHSLTGFLYGVLHRRAVVADGVGKLRRNMQARYIIAVELIELNADGRPLDCQGRRIRPRSRNIRFCSFILSEDLHGISARIHQLVAGDRNMRDRLSDSAGILIAPDLRITAVIKLCGELRLSGTEFGVARRKVRREQDIGIRTRQSRAVLGEGRNVEERSQAVQQDNATGEELIAHAAVIHLQRDTGCSGFAGEGDSCNGFSVFDLFGDRRDFFIIADPPEILRICKGKVFAIRNLVFQLHRF